MEKRIFVMVILWGILLFRRSGVLFMGGAVGMGEGWGGVRGWVGVGGGGIGMFRL